MELRGGVFLRHAIFINFIRISRPARTHRMLQQQLHTIHDPHSIRHRSGVRPCTGPAKRRAFINGPEHLKRLPFLSPTGPGSLGYHDRCAERAHIV